MLGPVTVIWAAPTSDIAQSNDILKPEKFPESELAALKGALGDIKAHYGKDVEAVLYTGLFHGAGTTTQDPKEHSSVYVLTNANLETIKETADPKTLKASLGNLNYYHIYKRDGIKVYKKAKPQEAALKSAHEAMQT